MNDETAKEDAEAFEKLQDKTLPVKVKLLALCPTKDLVAVVLSDSEVAIYRVLWQKLASFVLPFAPSSTVTVTALEWSPDGNLISVGRSDGVLDVFQLEREDNCPQEQTIFPSDSIASLYWVDLEKDMGCVDTCYRELIRREEKLGFINKQVLDKIPSTPTVLWLSSYHGYIRALMHGRVPLWSVFVGELVSHLYFSKRSYLFYACSNGRETILQARCFEKFQSLWGPFSWFAENVLQLDSSIHQYQSAYQKILSTLKDIGQMVQEKWNILSDMLQDYGESISDVRSAFLSLINGQVLSVFTPYFVNQITWMGAERWKKQIHEKISEHLMPSMKELSLVWREMLMRCSRLLSFLHEKSDIFADLYDQTLEMKQILVDIFQRWNELKQRILTFVDRLDSFVDWFCYHTRRFCGQEKEEEEEEDGNKKRNDAFHLPRKSLQVILFLDVKETPKEWFSPRKEWLSLDKHIDDQEEEDWKSKFYRLYYRGLEYVSSSVGAPLVWSFALTDISSFPECISSSSSSFIAFQEEERDGRIMIAYIFPETPQVKCLWLQCQQREWMLSHHRSFVLARNDCFIFRIMWYHSHQLVWLAMQPFKEEQSNKTTTTPYLCWLGISEITFNSATLETMSSCDVVSSSSSQVDSFQGHWQVSSSPGRNLIG